MTRFCANNVSHPGPFLTDSDGFTFCRACETKPAVEGHGVERSYESTGGLPTVKESLAAMSDDEGYQRMAALDDACSRAPAPVKPLDEILHLRHVYEGKRRIRSGAHKNLATKADKVRGRTVR